MEVESQSCDRISALPQDIIEEILTLMPIRDAIKTSILSKNWRYCWTRMPVLVFDDDMVDVSSSDEEINRKNLVSAIVDVLSLHKGPILELCFCITDTQIDNEFDLIMLHLSLSKNIKRLILNVLSYGHYKLPSSFFSLEGLNHLELSYCEFEFPENFNGFPMLKSLTFDVVNVTDDMLQQFITSCPLLQEFHWIWYQRIDLLVSEFVELFTSFASIKVLEISKMYIEDLGAGGMPHNLPITLPNLRILDLGVCFLDLSTVVCVISSSPNLEKIKIRLCYDHRWQCDERSQRTSTNFVDYSGLSLDHLKEMEITCFRDCDCGSWMKFLKFVMANSPVLEKARIWRLYSKVSVDEEDKMLRDFPSASPAAKFIIQQR